MDILSLIFFSNLITFHSPARAQSDPFIITPQGNVGIATSTPAALFTVGNGTMAATPRLPILLLPLMSLRREAGDARRLDDGLPGTGSAGCSGQHSRLRWREGATLHHPLRLTK